MHQKLFVNTFECSFKNTRKLFFDWLGIVKANNLNLIS